MCSSSQHIVYVLSNVPPEPLSPLRPVFTSLVNYEVYKDVFITPMQKL